ncbi:MAG: hypothetical protein PHN37_00620 [Candidatus Pacebacteria bacterium]|nr:hypothetical protein [Candidatus Paceibacterota bacterium]
MIIGHKKQWEILIKSKNYQAFLFSGQESLGKKKIAIEFAKFLRCQGKQKPCDQCSECLEIEKKISSDFVLVEPEQDIKINEIREIKRKMFLSTNSFKIAIIDKAHLMTKDSQNCFLKILEEPHKNTIFVLITEHPDLLLPTILSRVQQIKFFPVSKTEIQQQISEQEIIEYSLNQPGKALSLTLEKIKEYKNIINRLEKIKNYNIGDRFLEAKKISQENLSEIFFIWLCYLRKTFLEQCKNKKNYADTKKNIKNLQTISSLLGRTNVNKKLATELLLLELK